MKILYLSDTHGRIGDAQTAIETERPDQVIHLGDVDADVERLRELYPRLPICAVAGNNDWFSSEEKEKTVSIFGIKHFLCHGHTTGVKRDLTAQIAREKALSCRVSAFGHTHVPLTEERDGIVLINPGSCGYRGSYATLIGTADRFEVHLHTVGKDER